MATTPRAPNPRKSRSYIKAHGHGNTPDDKPVHLDAEHKDGRIVLLDGAGERVVRTYPG